MANLADAKEFISSHAIPAHSTDLAEVPGTLVRVRGVIASEAPLAGGVARLQVPGSPALLHYFSPQLTLALPSGKRIAIKVGGEDCFLPEETRKGPWAQLESDEVYRVFQRRGPGPHIEVSCAHSLLRPGDTVEVFGQVELSQTETSYREAPKQVAALAITSGADAGKLLEAWYAKTQQAQRDANKGKRSAKTLLARAALLLLTLFLLLAGYRLFTWEPTAIITGAIVLITLALITYIPYEDLPPFYLFQEGTPQEASKAPGLSGVLFFFGFVPTVLPGFFIAGIASLGILLGRIFGATFTPADLQDAYFAALGLCGVFFVWTLLVSLALLLALRPWKALASLLLNAPPYNPNAPSAWSSLTGRLRDLTPVSIVGRHGAIYFLENTNTKRIGKNTLHNANYEQQSRETFTLETPHGNIEVDPNQAIWSGTTTGTESDNPAPGENNTRKARLLAEGDQVLAVGRLEGQRLSATGPQSLLLFGDSADPRARLQAFVQKSQARLRTMLLCAAALLGLLLFTARNL